MNAPSQTQGGVVRKRVYYSGHVQGVGFRVTTLHIARRYRITGFVRNLADGRVELVAEGAPGVLDQLTAEIQQAMGGNITHCSIDDSAATGEFTSFSIAR